MRKRKKNTEENTEENLEELDIESSQQFKECDEDYDDGFEDCFDDFDEFKDDFDEEALKKEKKKEFYVKGSDLIAEIKKYQESKKTDPKGLGYISEELRSDDFEDLHKIFNASAFL